MKRHTHSHSHGERILIDEIAYASALRRVSPFWKIFVSLYSLLLCLISHTWAVSVLILCCMLTAMTAIGKTRWHHVIHLMQIPLAFVVLGCIMILLQISHHGESMLVSLHHRRKPASVRTGVFTVSGGSQLSVFSLCHYADDRTVYGTTPSASAGVSGGDDGTGLSVYLCADGVGFADSERTGMPPGVWLVKDQLLLHGTADLQSVPAGIPAGRPYLYGNGVQRVHR